MRRVRGVRSRVILSAFAVFATLPAPIPAPAGEEKLACPMGREYFLYTPDGIATGTAAAADKGSTSWLVVGVHGHRGNGKNAAGLASWTGRGDVIVVGPSFPDGYQGLAHETDQQLLGLFAELRKRFRLHPRMFLYGFSGGSQFTHRFALAHPDAVIGCASHSGGTWDDRVNPAAAGIPFAVSCGEGDTGKSVPEARQGRLDWFKDFVGAMQAANFSFKARTWPGVGHSRSAGAVAITEECFALATTGMHPPQRQEAEENLRAVAAAIDAGRFGDALQRLRALRGTAAATPGAKRPPRPAAKPGPTGAAPADSPPEAPATPSAATGTGGGTPVPGVSEDAFGWHMSPAGIAALESARKAHLARSVAELSARAEAAALRRIEAIVAERPADAGAQLATLAADCKDLPQVKVAANRAKARLKPAP